MYVYLSSSTVNPIPLQSNGESFSMESSEHSSPSSTIHDDSSFQITRADADEIDSTRISPDPFTAMIDAAKQGNSTLVQENANYFLEHTKKLIEIAETACLMSHQSEGIKLVRLAMMQVEDHSQQVVTAAQILATQSKSQIARENLSVCQKTWKKYLCLLTEAIDDITTMEDFLAISEKHILDDIDYCLQSLLDRNLDHLEQGVLSIQRRSNRIIEAMLADVKKYQSKQCIETVLISVNILRYQILPNFVTTMAAAMKIVRRNSMPDEREFEFIEQEFIQTSNRVYHGLRDLRNSLLMHPNPMSDEDSSALPSVQTTHPQCTEPDEFSYTSYTATSKQSTIGESIADQEKVAYWNDQDHDIIVLARKIGLIVMEMTEFTRGRGSMRTCADIINAAKEISQCGLQLNQLAKSIASQCSASETKSDLMSYIDRISLYCHQLDVTRRVRADLDQNTNNVIINGLDNIKSLINTAANLINAVVLTVQALYIASTKTPSKETMLRWTRCPPEKKSWSLLDQSRKAHRETPSGIAIDRLPLLDILNQFTKLQ